MEQEKIVKLETVIKEGYYRCWLRCVNCGSIFECELRYASIASRTTEHCPTCKIKSGTPNVGSFDVVKYNSEYENPNPYMR